MSFSNSQVFHRDHCLQRFSLFAIHPSVPTNHFRCLEQKAYVAFVCLLEDTSLFFDELFPEADDAFWFLFDAFGVFSRCLMSALLFSVCHENVCSSLATFCKLVISQPQPRPVRSSVHCNIEMPVSAATRSDKCTDEVKIIADHCTIFCVFVFEKLLGF